MASVVFQVRDRARGNVSTPMVLWSIAMAAVFFWAIVAPALSVTVSGLALTGLFGLYLGWRRRIGAVLIAPFVSWLFAWLPMEIASMIHFGIVKGFFLGLLIITFGWIGIGFVEFACLSIVALLVRSLRGDRDNRVVIIEHDHRA